MEPVSNIGVAGLAVMGENLVLNMENKGLNVSVYNRTISKVDHFLERRQEAEIFAGSVP